VVGLGTSAVASRAEACGGCFAPPGVPQVVTDHRMVLAVHATETVLWDQFQYAGDPRDFSWIFPLRYTDDVRLGVGTDAWIESLGNLTAPVLYAPPWPLSALSRAVLLRRLAGRLGRCRVGAGTHRGPLTPARRRR
jgi:hypothetical protein